MVEGLEIRSSSPLLKLESPEEGVMADKVQLDRTYNYILETIVKRGYAPHYAEDCQRIFRQAGLRQKAPA